MHKKKKKKKKKEKRNKKLVKKPVDCIYKFETRTYI